MGIEPTPQPWEGRVLPLYYTRLIFIIEILLRGLEGDALPFILPLRF